MTLGEILKKRRLEAGMTLQDVAKKAGVRTAQSVSNWESGSSTPRPKQILALAKHLKLDRDELAELAQRTRIQEDLIQDPQSFADLMFTRGHTASESISFYIICQMTLTLENPELATAIAKLAWEGKDVVYIYLNSAEEVWKNNMARAFEGFDMSLSQLSMETKSSKGNNSSGETLARAQRRIMKFDGCEDNGQIGIRHAAMISPLLTAVYLCCQRREHDALWLALPKFETAGAVWHKMPRKDSQLYRTWITNDLGIEEPYLASSERNDNRFQTLADFIDKRRANPQ